MTNKLADVWQTRLIKSTINRQDTIITKKHYNALVAFNYFNQDRRINILLRLSLKPI